MPLSEPASRFPLVAWLERRSRRQVTVVLAVLVLLVLLSFVRGLASTMLDRWWLDSVTDAPVWRTILGAKVVLVVGATLVSLVVLGGSVWRVLRTAPAGGPPPGRAVLRYQQRVGPAHRWALVAIAALIIWNIAGAAADEWASWLLFVERGGLPTHLPAVHGDLDYHLFSLPLLTTVTAWLRDLLLVTLVLTALGYVGTGALRWARGERRNGSGVALHLAVLGAALALVQAARHILVDRPNLATDRTGTFDGAGYAPSTVTSPGLVVLAVALVALAIGLVVTARTGRWKPLAAIGAVWLVLVVAVGWLAPAAVQRIVVDPDEASREHALVAANLAATRRAYGLDQVERTTRNLGDEQGSGAEVDADAVPPLSLFPPGHLAGPLQVLQGTPATRIGDVDLDRYEVDGERRPVLVAARAASRQDLPEQGWLQSHLVYTHGNGVVLAPADSTADDGGPDLGALDELLPERPELYFGEGVEGWYAIVGTDRTEQGGARFDAGTGIPIGTPWQRAVFALARGEIEPLLSQDLTPESQLLFRRGLRERLKSIAPFLSLDSDPYPVVADGRVVWVVDAYTTASTYPFSQFGDESHLTDGDLKHRRFNYVRGSVIATVDAYSGDVHLYRRDTGGADDPVLDAWSDIFPGMLEPIDEMPEAVREHLHYPSDLLAVQAGILGRYHVESAEELFDGSDRWSVSEPLPGGVSEKSGGAADAVSLFGPEDGPAEGSWITQHTYTPGASGRKSSLRDVLAGYAIADNDAERLTLVSVESPAGHPVNTPQVAQGLIDADPELARDFTFLDSSGSQVLFGPMTMVPVGESVAWIRPVIVVGGNRTSTPRLYRVLAVVGGTVGEGDDVASAIEDATTRPESRPVVPADP